MTTTTTTAMSKLNIFKTKTKKNGVYQEQKSEQKNNQNSAAKRETWTGKFDFFLTALGYAVGLGAIWRFPYLCYKNANQLSQIQGGGAFLIPYFIFLALVGIPLVFLEMSVGQFTSSGPMTCWVMSPLFRGIGFSVNIVNNYVNVYFTMILAYSLYFLIMSIRSELPWQNCNPNWPYKNCVDNFDKNSFQYLDCSNPNVSLKCDDGVCYNLTTRYGGPASCQLDDIYLQKIGYWNPIYPSSIYWKDEILKRSSGIDETGALVWQLLIALFVAWVIITLMVIKGIKVSGKIVYVTALFPYVVLLILGIRGWLLDGADIGIKYYIYPDFSKLKNLSVWSDAASQIFFTLSVCYGGLTALASYNHLNTNILRDAITVSLANCGTSIFAGFVVFSYIGYLAKSTGREVDEVVQAGQGLAFVVYPFAMTTIKGAPFWSCLFFIMMLVLGLDSTMGSIETFITSIFDMFPVFKKTSLRRYSSILVICGTFFGLGIIFCFQSGSYWNQIFDSYSGHWAIFILATLECVSVGWFYGFNNFRKDLSAMLGERIANNLFFNIFRLFWCFITPAIVIALCVIALIDFKNLESGDYKFPGWTLTLGYFISASTLLGVVIWPIYLLIDALFVNKRPLRTLLQPDVKWRPLKLEDRIKVDNIHGRKTKIESLEDLEGYSNMSFTEEIQI